MSVVYKYEFTPADTIELIVPRGAQILHCEMQRRAGAPSWCAWCLVEPAMPLEKRRIRMAGTGHPINTTVGRFINTTLVAGGDLVFHFFEV